MRIDNSLTTFKSIAYHRISRNAVVRGPVSDVDEILGEACDCGLIERTMNISWTQFANCVHESLRMWYNVGS